MEHPLVLCEYIRWQTIIITYIFLGRHLVHASDHEQAEALLTRWGPDRVGKLGSELQFSILFDGEY